MSDYVFVADRAKKAFARVSHLEAALAKRPNDKALALNLASMKRRAVEAQKELDRLAEINRIEVCRYKILPEIGDGYALEHVSSVFLAYQNLFSQIHDALKNGPKMKSKIGREAASESELDFAYSYSGSLGVVLLVKSERNFFDGSLDRSISQLYDVLEVTEAEGIRELASRLGRAVVKRIHDYSLANVRAGFSADVRWHRSDGKDLGQVIDRRRMEKIVASIGSASDETTTALSVTGMLVGASLPKRTFHITVPDGPSFAGSFGEWFDPSEMTIGKFYKADLLMSERYFYATEKHEIRYVLERMKMVTASP